MSTHTHALDVSILSGRVSFLGCGPRIFLMVSQTGSLDLCALSQLAHLREACSQTLPRLLHVLQTCTLVSCFAAQIWQRAVLSQRMAWCPKPWHLPHWSVGLTAYIKDLTVGIR